MKKRILLFALALLTVATCFLPAIPARAVTARASSDALVSKMKAREGFSATPYWDVSHWSIGYGTTCPNDKVDYYKKNPMSEAEAEAEFRKFLNRFEANVNDFAAKHNLNLKQHQFDALVSFTYNCGAGWMSSLSGYFNTAVRAGDVGAELLYGMALYSTAGGEYILIGRRLWEANMYLNGDYGEGEKGSYPDSYGWVFLDGGPAQVRYKICAFDTNLPFTPPQAFSHIPTGVDAEGNTFIYEFGGWYTADGKEVTVLDGTLSRGQYLYARWLDPQGNPLPQSVQTFPVEATVVNVSDTVNVRKGPGTSYGKNGTFAKGEAVTVLEEVQGEYVSYCATDIWCKIAEDKYVIKYYLQYPETENNVQTETDAKITSLEVVKAPTQTHFTEQNISPDWEGSVLKATYEDGFVKALTITRSMTSGFDPAKNGTQKVTVSYGGLKTTFEVTVQLESGWKQDVVGWYHLVNGAKEKMTWKQDSKGLCYLDEQGYFAKNYWAQDEKGWRYLGADGYPVYSQWQPDHKGLCYIDDTGYMAKSRWIKDTNGWRYVNDQGYVQTNQWILDDTGWRYVDVNGYALCNQWLKDSVGWVYLGADGYMAKNQWARDSKGLCYVGANGYILTSQWLPYEGCTCYVGADGYADESTIGHTYGSYKNNNNATCTTNATKSAVCPKCKKTDTQTLPNTALGHSFTKYLSDNNATTTADGTKTAKCDRCSVTNTIADPGSQLTNGSWQKDSRGWYYLENGQKAVSCWRKDSKGLCYLGADGYMVYNKWVKDSKDWRYLGSDGYVAKNRWQKDSVGWCYLGDNGYQVFNKWVKDSIDWCYVGANGYMVYNQWVKDSVGWCYVGKTGYMVRDTYVRDSVGKCYINKSGYWDGKYR